MPKPKPPKEKVLVLARFEQIANYAMMRIADLGMEADKAMTNEEADAFLEDPKTHYIAAVLGNVFVNRPTNAGDLKQMKEKLEARGIPYAECPTFGDAPSALQTLGLADVVDGKWQRVEKGTSEAAIAG